MLLQTHINLDAALDSDAFLRRQVPEGLGECAVRVGKAGGVLRGHVDMSCAPPEDGQEPTTRRSASAAVCAARRLRRTVNLKAARSTQAAPAAWPRPPYLATATRGWPSSAPQTSTQSCPERWSAWRCETASVWRRLMSR